MGDREKFFGKKDSYGNYKGLTFSIIAAFWWLMYVVEEVRDVFFFARLGYDGRLAKPSENNPDEVEKVNLCCIAKVCTLLVAVVRFYVAERIGSKGVQFLFQTIYLKDLILNSVALTFMYEIDDLFYRAFVPLQPQASLKKWTMTFRAYQGSCSDLRDVAKGLLTVVL